MMVIDIIQTTEEMEQTRLNENKLSVAFKEKSDELEILSANLEETKSELQKKVPNLATNFSTNYNPSLKWPLKRNGISFF
jgi:hypothetical protein